MLAIFCASWGLVELAQQIRQSAALKYSLFILMKGGILEHAGFQDGDIVVSENITGFL